MKFIRARHQLILKIFEEFDADYLQQNNILFGGGTRIAMELGEFRESTDIDFCCVGKTSYRAVRSETTSDSLGSLLKPDTSLKFVRDIRADRDAVRTFVSLGESGPAVKLEFIHFDYDDLAADQDSDFPVPVLDKTSCWLNKLLANADRYMSSDRKDILDLCMMHRCWGKIPEKAWQQADDIYSQKIVLDGLTKALSNIQKDPDNAFNTATNSLAMSSELADELINKVSRRLASEITKRQKKINP